MTGPQVDYAAVFRDLPIPVLLLTPEFVIADMNLAYLQVAGRTREELLGRVVFDAFPDNPADPESRGTRDQRASLERVLATAKPDALSMQKYDVEVPGSPGLFAKRYWNPVNAPVFGPDGRVVLIAQCVEEITQRVSKFIAGLADSDAQLAAPRAGDDDRDRRAG
jgi:PAS domain-containing protein